MSVSGGLFSPLPCAHTSNKQACLLPIWVDTHITQYLWWLCGREEVSSSHFLQESLLGRAELPDCLSCSHCGSTTMFWPITENRDVPVLAYPSLTAYSSNKHLFLGFSHQSSWDFFKAADSGWIVSIGCLPWSSCYHLFVFRVQSAV